MLTSFLGRNGARHAGQQILGVARVNEGHDVLQSVSGLYFNANDIFSPVANFIVRNWHVSEVSTTVVNELAFGNRLNRTSTADRGN